MKILELFELHIITRKVWYFGNEIEIPADHHYVAVDSDGYIYSYQIKPDKLKATFFIIDDDIDYMHSDRMLGLTENFGDWRNTLVEYPHDYVFTEPK